MRLLILDLINAHPYVCVRLSDAVLGPFKHLPQSLTAAGGVEGITASFVQMKTEESQKRSFLLWYISVGGTN